MSELRHSRDVTRFQRDRMIKKRKKSYMASWWSDVPNSNNWFTRNHFSDCSCGMCVGPRYERTKFDWRRALYDQDYASLERKVIQNGW